ncbi:MAG: AsmA family protein [Pseudomonadota bacterium]
MNKLVKVGVIGAGLVVALAALALGIFMATFDINSYRGTMARIVAEKTGRELSIDGDISLTFFPRLGVSMEDVSLSDAPGFGDTPMAMVRKARLDVRVLPLFSGRVRFGHLDIQGAVLTLRRDPSGLTNWDDLTGRTTETGPKSTDQDRAEDAVTNAFDLEIAGVSVTGSDLVWDDRAGGVGAALHNLSLTTGTIAPGEPFGVTMRCDFGSGAPLVEGNLEMTGTVAISADAARVTFTDTTLKVMALGETVPGSRADVTAKAQTVAVDMRGQGASGHGKVGQTVRVVGQTLRVDGLTVAGYGLTARASGSLTGLGSAARLTASVGLDRFDVRKTLAALGWEVPRTADPVALTRAEATAALVVDAGGFEVRELEAVIDDTVISGSLSSREREGAARDVVRLAIETLDLDRYLPPRESDQGGSGRTADSGGSDLDLIIDAVRLRDLSLDLEATARALRVAGVRMTDVQVTAGARHGLVRVSPVKATLYGGNAAVGLTINAVGEHPASDVIIGVDQVDVGGLSRDALGSEEYQGVLTLNAALACQGARRNAMLRSTNGRFTLNLADGVFPGVDLMSMARTTHEQRNRADGSVEAARTDTTRFGSITATGVVANGVARSRDLEVKAPGLRADGQGSVDLPSGRIDSLIKVKLVPTAQGQGGRSSDDLYGVMVPIRVTGTLDQPSYQVSIAEYIKALGGAVLDTAGSVVDTAGSVVEGVTGVIKGVGKAVMGGDDAKEPEGEKKRGFLGLF